MKFSKLIDNPLITIAVEIILLLIALPTIINLSGNWVKANETGFWETLARELLLPKTLDMQVRYVISDVTEDAFIYELNTTKWHNLTAVIIAYEYKDEWVVDDY
ncbi:MAG: hypothetical protein ACFFB3_05560 [Candidatus Hodarchaeota archaeon]